MPMRDSLMCSCLVRKGMALVVAGLVAMAAAARADDRTDAAAATGAQIDLGSVRATVHVAADAAPGGDGSENRPFNTLEAGLRAATTTLSRGMPTRVLVHPGVYREGELRPDLGDGEAARTLLVIEGVDPERCVISGSDEYPAGDWTDLGDGLFSHPWPHRWGHFTYRWGPPQPMGHRREMVFVNGRMLRQVAIERYDYEGHKLSVDGQTTLAWTYRESLDPAEALTPGTFGVAERQGLLYVRVADPASFRSSRVEAAARRRLLVFENKENLAIRRLTFQHAANDYRHFRADGPLTLLGAMRNVLIEDCRFLWNNFDGLPLPQNGSDFTLRRVDASYNGYGGMAHGASNLLLEDCQTNFNNWRGHWGDQRSWNMGGFKLGSKDIDRVTIRRHTAIGNLCPGLWTDIHPSNVRVEDSVMALNDRMGLFFELSNGPHVAERCLIIHNAKEQYVNSIAGVAVLRDSVVYGNSTQNSGRHRLPEPVIRMQWYNRQDSHARQRPLTPSVARLEGNVVAGGKLQWLMLIFQNGLPRQDERYRAWRLEASGNVFHGPVNEAFLYNSDDWAIHIVQLDRLQQDMGLSSNAMADPKFIDPDRLDFRVADDSPIADRRDRLPLKQLDPAWLDRAAAFFDWAGYDRPPLLREHSVAEQRDF